MSGHISRRKFLKSGAAALGMAASGILPNIEPLLAAGTDAKPKVYLTRELGPEGLCKMYELVKQPLNGKIAIKLHTGEQRGPNIIPVSWIKALLPQVPGATVVETNVLYSSPRQTTRGHRETLRANGWDFCTVDIMDEHGDVNLPVRGGKWFKEIAMGGNITNYDSMLVLTHFKGHTMGGFGGSIKNIAIGCASGKVGKKQLHHNGDKMWGFSGERFMEHMAESAKAVVDHFGQRIVFINVLRNMSVDCDCIGTGAAPVVTPDIGILASTSLLAVDQASVDMVYALPEKDRHALVERIESRSGLRQLSYLKELGMDGGEYELVRI